MRGPGEGGAEASMSLSFGSTLRDQTSRKALRASRFLRVTRAGASGAGKRRDSEKVRVRTLASPVVSHSPKIEQKPRE